MAMKRISKSVVEAMKTGEMIWDSNLTGFGVRRKLGAPSYLVKYGTGRRGRSRWLTIGPHGGPWIDAKGKPCLLGAETARKEALRLLGENAKGNDPAAVRDRVRRLPTLSEFSTRYLEDHAKPHKKPRSYLEDKRNLDKVILPALGRIRIDQLTRSDVTRFHLSRKKTPTNANRCLALLSHMMTMAEKWGFRADGSNPCRHVTKWKETKRDKYLSPAELGRLAEALNAIEETKPMEAAAIRLLAFTGARRGEILNLTHGEVDLENRVLKLKDSKTGKKPVKLNAPSIAILAGLPRLAGCNLVVWGSGGRPLGGIHQTWTAVRKAAGLVDIRLHDLRHSFASVLVSGGASLPLIGALLGHANPSTTARYAHLYDDPVTQAAERAGEAIASAMKRGAK